MDDDREARNVLVHTELRHLDAVAGNAGRALIPIAASGPRHDALQVPLRSRRRKRGGNTP